MSSDFIYLEGNIQLQQQGGGLRGEKIDHYLNELQIK